MILGWSAGNVGVYTDPTGGDQVTNRVTYANTGLPKTLWGEGTAPGTTPGDVVFRLDPVEADCPRGGGCDRAVMTVIAVDFIEASCPKANNTPQQFEGHKTDFGDPCATNNPGQVLVIFHKDARDANLVVQDFDVTLNAHALPPSVTDDQLNESWAKVAGPDSGSLNRTDTFAVRYQNPRVGC